MIDSPIGYFMRAIKDDELRAKSLGIDTTRVKVVVFSISSAIAGLAGGFYGHYIVTLTPQMLDFSEMAKIVVMVVIGGFGTFVGPVVGAAPVQHRANLSFGLRRMEPRLLRRDRDRADALQHGGHRGPAGAGLAAPVDAQCLISIAT